MLKLSLNLIWRYTTGNRSWGRFHTPLRELIDCFTAESWSTNWFVSPLTGGNKQTNKQTGEVWHTCWLLVLFVSSPGLSLLGLSFLACAALWRGSCPSSAALLWAQILPTCAESCREEEAALLSVSTPNPGVDHTAWEMLTTEKDGRPNSSIRPADVLVSAGQCYSESQLNSSACDLSCSSVLQVILQVTTVVSVSLAGLDQTVTREKLLWCVRTSTPWLQRSSRSFWMFWTGLKPPFTQTMLLPPSTGWDSWVLMEPAHRSPISPSTTSLCGNITTQSETRFWVNEPEPLELLKGRVWSLFMGI